MIDSIGFHSLKCMDMSIGRTKYIATMDTALILPILCIFVYTVGDHIGNSGAGSASSPMTGFICVVDILMTGSAGAAVTAAVANLVTVRGVDVLVYISFLLASGANLPMLCFIIVLLTVGFVAGFQYITTSLARLQATVYKIMLLMTNSATAICAACPVINAVMLPVTAYSVCGCGLLIAYAADLLMFRFINVREITVFMLTGCVD